MSDYPLVLPLLVAKHLQQRTPLVDLFFWDVHIAMLAGFVSIFTNIYGLEILKITEKNGTNENNVILVPLVILQ